MLRNLKWQVPHEHSGEVVGAIVGLIIGLFVIIAGFWRTLVLSCCSLLWGWLQDDT